MRVKGSTRIWRLSKRVVQSEGLFLSLCSTITTTPEGCGFFPGRDALLRVRDGKPNTDAEHRVPTRLG